MGTSQKYKASVSGQPNWGRMTASLMSLAASEAKDEELAKEEQELEEEQEQEQEQEQPEQEERPHEIPIAPLPKRKKSIEKRRKRLNVQLENNLKKSVSHAVKEKGCQLRKVLCFWL